jgi:hypothetical protein
MAVRWKRRESEAAALFGARRNVLSGSSGRDDRDGSDSTHPRLWIETKAHARTAVRTLWEATEALVWKKTRGTPQEGRRCPVLVIYDKGRHGGLIVVHQEHFAEVAAEFVAAMDDQSILEFERAVRVRRGLVEEVAECSS